MMVLSHQGLLDQHDKYQQREPQQSLHQLEVRQAQFPRLPLAAVMHELR